MERLKRWIRNALLIAAHALFMRPVLRLFGVRFRRRHLVPKGPCIVVANHNSHLDAVVLMSLFPLRRLPHVHPVAAADYFRKNWLLSLLSFVFMNAIPIERRPSPGVDPLAPVAEAIRQGETLIFFPEGSRGEAGVVAPFRKGIGRLVREAPGLLVVPVFLSGPERIWPRGQMVMVPLSIDVHVGKPRTYPPDEDPAVIAESVREDVLALAPPPPPAPGRRPPPPVVASVAGIDAVGRESLGQSLAQRLGSAGRAVYLGRRYLEADAEGLREPEGGEPVTPPNLALAVTAAMLKLASGLRGGRLAEALRRAQLEEALRHGDRARFVVTDGSAMLDLLAGYAAGRARALGEREIHRMAQVLAGQRHLGVAGGWRLLRQAPAVWWVALIRPVRLIPPDVILTDCTSPAQVMARRRAAGLPMRAGENERYLAALQEAYVRVAGILARGFGTRLVDCAACRSRGEDPVAAAAAACLRAWEERAPEGSAGEAAPVPGPAERGPAGGTP